uniref:FA core complex associated protein 24 n=1 Tax=Salarias fasciatus TaxID=181472 RepID=A0A672FKP6_SALFA
MDPGAAAPRPVNAVPPYGHVICCEKWRNSALVQSLRGVKILFENELGVADFHLPNRTKVLYVSESDMVAANSYKRKLVRFRNASSSFQQLVLVEQTVLSQQYFAAVQRFVSLDLGLALLPVGGQAEASQLVTQMVTGRSRDNPFGRRPPCQILEPAVLAAVRQIPGVGRVKALALLQSFSSIWEICSASPEQLERVVGRAAATHIHDFFHTDSAAGS